MIPENAPQWLKDAETEDAVVTIEENGEVVWHNGTWLGGTWLGGIWEGGEWHNGTWLGGTWLGGMWHNGMWRDGTWHNGTWSCGLWFGGGWHNGTWHNGTWSGGLWRGGVWVKGQDAVSRCPWKVTYDVDAEGITIGCRSETADYWDTWFAGDEEFETPRGTPEFRLIERAYQAARAAMLFDATVAI